MPELDLWFSVEHGLIRMQSTEDGMMVRVSTKDRELPFSYKVLSSEEFGGVTGVAAITPSVHGMYDHIVLAHNDDHNSFALIYCVGEDYTELPEGWEIIWSPDPNNPEDQRRFTRDVFGRVYPKWEEEE